MYESIYSLLQNALYTSVTLTGWQELFLTVVSSTAILFAVAVPFMIVWKVIKIIVGR